LMEGRGFRCLVVPGLFDRLHPPHALATPCGIVVRRRILLSERPFAQPTSDSRCQGFSPRAAESLVLSCGLIPFATEAAAARSLRPSAGGAHEESEPRAHDVTLKTGPIIP
jgi:hypothetical protein